MKERPILFSGEMVRAILSGTKTQTRRVVKPQPIAAGWAQDRSWVDEQENAENSTCPHGQPGDRLWVREGVRLDRTEAERDWNGERAYASYLADGALVKLDSWGWERSVLPGIFLPRGLSRITLELTQVRVERLQDIGEEDARAEGCAASELVTRKDGSPCYTEPFRKLWLSIHGIDNPKAWESNPWVWVLSFKRVDSAENIAGGRSAIGGAG